MLQAGDEVTQSFVLQWVWLHHHRHRRHRYHHHLPQALAFLFVVRHALGDSNSTIE